ncbi:sacsin N-terminal ATP-binding-like domain-containing protein, partial [Streptomyces sp. NPDC058953]|uniref:sacsin N-terminal ATP-binding-like domain-containing protein n=1 Tax=Streptomyces sp. NPDC058953 TaxID=3346676 RepID=UPI0036784A7F
MSEVIKKVVDQSERVLETYRVDPGLVQEHANGERRITQGGYGDRQLFELVQNAADEIANDPNANKLHAVLTETHLYCANEGTAVTSEGAETILRMSVSRKRGGQIGRFGVGVKSVLSITDTPQFFSRSGSFGFDREWSRARILEALGAPPDADLETPVLRMARPLDARRERGVDPVLDELMQWASTVVRLPLLEGAAEEMGRDMFQAKDDERREFPAHFQLFSHHVGTVVLEDRRTMPVRSRTITVRHEGHTHVIREKRTQRAEAGSEWLVFGTTHEPSPAGPARAGGGGATGRGGPPRGGGGRT